MHSFPFIILFVKYFYALAELSVLFSPVHFDTYLFRFSSAQWWWLLMLELQNGVWIIFSSAFEQDAASLSVAILKKKLRNRIFLGCDNHPLSRSYLEVYYYIFILLELLLIPSICKTLFTLETSLAGKK